MNRSTRGRAIRSVDGSGRWRHKVLLLTVSGVGAVVIPTAPSGAAAATCASNAMYVVAHEDDSLLFQSPDLLHDVQGGKCLTTVYVTAGDQGYGTSYMSVREQAADAGYANMAGVADTWTSSTITVNGHTLATDTLSARPNLVQVFLRLPDGNTDGSGYAADGNESLLKLWTGTIGTIHPIDGSSGYTAQDLADTLTALMTTYQPSVVHVQDYVGTVGDNDHADHHVSAYFARAANNHYSTPHTLIGYLGYDSQNRTQNVSGPDLKAKQNAFYAYAKVDNVCSPPCSGTQYAAWLKRQYTVGSIQEPAPDQAPTASAGDNANAYVGSTVTLTGSGSDPDGDLVSYQWTQTGGPSVSLANAGTRYPTFVAPSSTGTLTFQLVTSDGTLSSAPSNVTVSVNNSEVSLIATASASSQDTADGSTADKAVDGVVDGFPGDATKEWSTAGGLAGSWLKLTWSSPHTLSSVVLHDRPNPNDQITAATLAFDNGTVIKVGALPNDGTGLTVAVPSITTSSLTLTVKKVSSTTQNVGLAELEAWQ